MNTLSRKKLKFTNSSAKILTGELFFISASSFFSPVFFMLPRVDRLLRPFIKDSSCSSSDSLFLTLTAFSPFSNDVSSASIVWNREKHNTEINYGHSTLNFQNYKEIKVKVTKITIHWKEIGAEQCITLWADMKNCVLLSRSQSSELDSYMGIKPVKEIFTLGGGQRSGSMN